MSLWRLQIHKKQQALVVWWLECQLGNFKIIFLSTGNSRTINHETVKKK